MRKALLIALLLSGGVLAQSASDTYSLSGQVVDGATGKPWSGVKLQVASHGPFQPVVTSNAEGRFQFTKLNSGRYELVALIGNDRMPYGEFPSGEYRTVWVGPGAKAPLLFRLALNRELRGSVRDELGDGVTRATVVLGTQVWRLGKLTVRELHREYTDDRGSFLFPKLRPGRYTLCAAGPKAELLPPVGTIDFAQRNQYRVFGRVCSSIRLANDTPQVNLMLPAKHAVVVRGNLSAIPTKSGYGVRIFPADMLTGSENTTIYEAYTNEPAFEITSVPPGRYRIEATAGAQDLAESDWIAMRMINVDAVGLDNVELKLERQAVMHVALHVPPNTATDSISISLRPNDPDSTSWSWAQWPGGFRMTHVNPGSYWLRMNTDLPLCAVSATLDQQDVSRSPLTIVPGMVGNLEITLSNRCGEIEGKVLWNGKPAPFSKLVLLLSGSTAAPGEIYDRSFSNENGEFAIPNIAPGRYQLWAWSQDDAEYLGPENLADIADFAGSVEVRAGQTATVELRQMRPAKKTK
jgi:hypothetical protein